MECSSMATQVPSSSAHTVQYEIMGRPEKKPKTSVDDDIVVLQGLCLICKKGDDQVLICCTTGGCACQIHASCLGCLPSIDDDTEKFCCPQCSYDQATFELKEAEKKLALATEKALSAKKSLSLFVKNKDLSGTNNGNLGMTEEHQHTDAEAKIGCETSSKPSAHIGGKEFASSSSKDKSSPKHSLNPKKHKSRCKSVRWTSDEEEMLMKGLAKILDQNRVENKKISDRMKSNIPWRKILAFGSHVFNEGRTAVQLREKWRRTVGSSDDGKDGDDSRGHSDLS